MAEMRYCIICGKEIQSDDPDEVFCTRHNKQSFPRQNQQAGLPNPQYIDQYLNAAAWKPDDVILDAYVVKEELGKGGFGQVYRVHHTGWNMDLAVKRPRADKFQTEKAKLNFIKEAETWVDLGLHPHITSCYYVRMIDEMPHVFIECMEGGSLESWIQRKNGNLYEGSDADILRRLLDLAIQFAWGVEFAHSQNLIHRDIKPQNALMTPDGILKVTDFGLARGKGAMSKGDKQESSQKIKVSGIAYSPYHCSPEQVLGMDLSIKTDIWSWGVSVLEMFNGKITWAGGQIADGALESYLRRGGEPHIPPMPDTLAELLRECLQRHPDNRPADMLTITEKLMRIYHQEIGQAYPREKPDAAELKADSLNNKALTMLDLGKPEKAELLLEQALENDSGHVEAMYNLGLLQWRSGRISDVDVLQSLVQIQQNQPKDSGAASALGWVCLESGRFDKALGHFKQAVRLGVDSDSEHGLVLARPLSESGAGECLRTFEGHTSAVWSVAISPDGRQALSGSLKLWDLATGECLRTFEGHTSPVESVAISPDGRRALSGSGDCTLKLWDLATGSCLRTFEGHKNAVSSVAISPDGHQALSGSWDRTLKLWDLAQGACLRTFKGHKDFVDSVAISPGGHEILSGSADKTLKLWDLATGECLRTFEGHTKYVSSVAISPDGRWALSGSYDKTLKLWDMTTGECLRTFEGHTDWVVSVAISPAGSQALSGSSDNTVKLWDLAKGECLRTFEGHTDLVFSVAFSPDGRQALSGSRDKTLRLWDLAWLEENHYVAPQRYARGLAGSEAARRERTHAAYLQQARKELKKGQIADALAYLEQARGVPGFERAFETLALYARVGAHSRITGIRGGWVPHTFEGHTETVNSVAFSPDGRQALSGSGEQHDWRDKTLKLWDIASGQCQRTFFRWHKDDVESVAISPDGREILSGSMDNTLKLWDIAKGTCLRTFEGHEYGVSSVAISPDGRRVLSGSRDKTLKLWDMAKGACLRTFEGHKNHVNSVAISPDGCEILSGSDDNTLKLWDIASGQCLRTFEGHTGYVYSVAISPDGRQALSGSRDATLKLWDLVTGGCLRTLKGHEYSVRSVAISPDGRKALSGSDDNTLKLWDLATGRCLYTFEGHESSVRSVAISPDGRQALSGSDDNTLKLWDLDWVYEFPGWADWDQGARPYLEIFLTLHTPFAGHLPQDREPTEEEIELALTRSGKPTWAEADFQKLLIELGHCGYGWLRPEGVRQKLEEMAKERGSNA